MPRVAFERGAVQRQYPLADMAAAILQACQDKPNAGLSGKPALALHHR
jgi:chemotaxis response regulator CheB